MRDEIRIAIPGIKNPYENNIPKIMQKIARELNNSEIATHYVRAIVAFQSEIAFD